LGSLSLKALIGAWQWIFLFISTERIGLFSEKVCRHQFYFAVTISTLWLLRLCLWVLDGLNTAMFNPRLSAARVRCLGTIGLITLLAQTATAAESYTENPGTEGDGKHTVGPEYKIDPDLTDRGNPKGKSFEFTMLLADSKIFRGDDSTLEPEKKPVRKERKIFVYVPAAYRDGGKAPVLVIHDGPGQINLVRNALDNLTICKDPNRKLPAFVAIAVQNGGSDAKNSERGLEYDTMSDRLARFIHGEVLSAVLTNAEIKAAYPKLAFTDNPWGRAVMGCSSGGAAALSMGWFRPDLFRRLIAYSGTFVDQQDDDAAEEAKYPLGAWEYHSSMKLVEKSEKKPLRIFTHVSENDLRAKDPEETYHNWVMAGERTAAALKAKGYNQRYVFSLATAHCDRRVFEHTLADTLVWIWRGYHGE
jgi:iron(III)-enterobactin esterase